MFVDYY